MNAHGLDDDDHYTTAHDMAIIFDAALKNDVFRYVVQEQPTRFRQQTSMVREIVPAQIS